ncbi:unnamed protein product [Lampetra fluviatilis]
MRAPGRAARAPRYGTTSDVSHHAAGSLRQELNCRVARRVLPPPVPAFGGGDAAALSLAAARRETSGQSHSTSAEPLYAGKRS